MFLTSPRKHRIMCWRVLFFFFSTFMVVLPLICNRLKFSIYYGVIWPRNITKDTNYLKQENDQRFTQAKQYLKFITDQRKGSQYFKIAAPTNQTDIVISVITVSRKITTYNPNYLTQTVSKLSEQLLNIIKSTRFSFGLMVCNVDSTPEYYEESKNLSRLFFTVVKYKYKQLLDITSNRFEKEKQDYTYCLGQSLVYNPKYVLLMEDDAYPMNNMLEILEYSIQNIFEGKISMFSRQPNNVAYLKLYHPERLLNFLSIEYYRLFELVSAILVLFTIFTLLNNRFLHLYTSWRFYIISATFIVLLALAIGRQNFLVLRRISKHFHSFVPAPSCCTPANLYSYQGAIEMIDSFSGKTSYPGHAKDMLLNEFLAESNYKAIYVEPNIFQHIGQYSSLRRGSILNPYVV